MKSMSKALAGTIAAGAMVMSSASPAVARDGHGGIGAGEVIAGALVIGGIAAIAAAAGNNDGDRYAYSDRDYDGRWDRDDRYGRYDRGYGRDNPRGAVAQCVQAAEVNARRVSYGPADVTDVRTVRETRRGYEIHGRIAVNTRGRDWRHGDGDYGRGWNGDYRGWNNSLRGYDAGWFRCKVERGRVVDLNYSGIRGL